jgi:hypothetical protein
VQVRSIFNGNWLRSFIPHINPFKFELAAILFSLTLSLSVFFIFDRIILNVIKDAYTKKITWLFINFLLFLAPFNFIIHSFIHSLTFFPAFLFRVYELSFWVNSIKYQLIVVASIMSLDTNKKNMRKMSWVSLRNIFIIFLSRWDRSPCDNLKNIYIYSLQNILHNPVGN